MANDICMICAPPQDAPPLPELPEEIITDILLRLPVKSLLKFRCVSQSWIQLISSPSFAKAHLRISTKNNVYYHDSLLFGSKCCPLDLYTCSLQTAVYECDSNGSVYPSKMDQSLTQRACLDCDLFEPDDVIWIIGSCNGLICLSLCVDTLILWNPTTRKWKTLPNSCTSLDVHYYGITYGFGYDELRDDYKVVEFFSFNLSPNLPVLEIQVKVYSLRTNSWKTLSNWPGGDTFGGAGTFLDGAIHWSVTDFDELVEWEIVAHDLATDTFSVLPLPEFEGDNVRVGVKILRGCLALCCERNSHMDIWLMKQYGVVESWTKVACIPFFLNLTDYDFTRPCPLFLSMDGKILMNYGRRVRVYDVRHPEIHHFGESSEVDAVTYVESLVSPILEDDTLEGALPLEMHS